MCIFQGYFLKSGSLQVFWTEIENTGKTPFFPVTNDEPNLRWPLDYYKVGTLSWSRGQRIIRLVT